MRFDMGEESRQLVGTPCRRFRTFRLWKLETVGGIAGQGTVSDSIAQRLVEDAGGVADSLRCIARRRQVPIEALDGAWSKVFQFETPQILDSFQLPLIALPGGLGEVGLRCEPVAQIVGHLDL